MNRVIKLVITLVLATSGFLVAGGAVSGAQAVTEHRVSSVAATGTTAERATRTAVMKFKQTSRVSFKLWVKVTPAGGKKPASLQYSKKNDGTFRSVRKAKMNAKGVAKFGKVSKVGYYRVSVPKTKNYSRTFSSNYIRIFRK